MKLHVDIVSAEGQLYTGEAQMLFAPGCEGELGITPRHAPLLTRLKPGVVRVELEGKQVETIFVSGGILEVQPDLVTILADTAERAADINESHALAAQREAEERLQNGNANLDLARAQAELAEAAARLHAIKMLKRPKH